MVLYRVMTPRGTVAVAIVVMVGRKTRWLKVDTIKTPKSTAVVGIEAGTRHASDPTTNRHWR